MADPDLARIHLQLRYRVGADDSLDAFPEELDAPPRILLVRQPGATRAYFGPRTPDQARRRVRELGADEVFEHVDDLEPWLGGASVGRWQETVLYRLPDPGSGASVRPVTRHAGHFIVLDEGRPVAWAWTVRAHGLAEEVAVETVPAFRRLGLGRAVLRAWTSQVVHSGRIAFYPVASGDAAATGLADSVRGEPLATTRSVP